ncbi:MAG: T9SS type A sorting domain-containing protein [Candidatus Aquicultor sp.]
MFDILGNEVMTIVNEQKEIGRYSVQFDASSLASGMYVYQLRVNDYISTKKMMLVK